MKNKRLILSFIGLIGLLGSTQAQNGFNVPFSQFGLGIGQQPFNLPLVTRMGGACYTLSGNNYVNPFNPASYSSVETQSFVFDMGMYIQTSRLHDKNNHLDDADGNLGYLLMAMPLTKWWKVAAGLMPYTDVSYESVTTQNVAGVGDVKNIYFGNGGINEVFLGSAFNVLHTDGKRPDLQVGFNLNYLTGNIQHSLSYSFQGNDSTYFINGRRDKTTRVGNIAIDLGLLVRQPVGKRAVVSLGLTYKPYMDLTVKDQAMIYTFYMAGSESVAVIDTIFPARGEEEGFTSRLEQAQTIGVGVSLEVDKRWLVAADATFAGWNGMKYTEGQTPSIMGTSMLRYGPYSSYAVGVQRTGTMDATTYWGRMSWSLGAHLTQGVLRLHIGNNDQALNEWGMGGGVTLPMRKGRSLLTLSAGYANLGTTEILQLNTLTFGIAVSSCERWFVKRKYN